MKAKQVRSTRSISLPSSQPLNPRFASFQQAAREHNSWLVASLGWLPVVTLVMALGFMLISFAFRASVSSTENLDGLYWVGLLLVVGPAAARLAALSPSRRERLVLVVLLGIALYGVKVIHSPSAFTYSDELVHVANAEQVLRTHHLFGENSILPVTPNYPGLPIVTTALASLSGLSLFASGLLVIGAARLVIILGLFLIYEKLSGSARIAGLAAVIYMANSNYLYWSAQFAYESLALPLAVFVLFVILVIMLRQSGQSTAIALPAIPIVLVGLQAVSVTHHLTSIALAGLLAMMALFSTVITKESWEAKFSLWLLTIVALYVVLFWTFLISGGTLAYLLPVVSRAVSAGLNFIFSKGTESGRGLFQSTGSFKAPVWERLAGISSVLIILAAIPFGLWSFLRRLRSSPLAWVLVLATLVYFPLQGLRLTGAGWETANRASEFLYVGIAFVVALALLTRWWSDGLLRGKSNHPRSTALVTGILVGIVFIGGVISGWPPTLRMAQPYRVRVVGPQGVVDSIEPQGVNAAKWAFDHLGPGNRMAADSSNARLMQAYGGQYTLAGEKFGIRDLFLNKTIDRGELQIIQITGIQYLVFGHPFTPWEELRGLHYNPAEGLAAGEVELQQGISQKFDLNPRVDRLLDTGQVVIYKVGGLVDASIEP